MEQKDIIIRVEHVSKLYGPNKSEAAKMMEAGSTKDEVYRKTGCTVSQIVISRMNVSGS